MMPMKGNILKTNKSVVRKKKKSSPSRAAEMRRKITQTFAEQVDAFINRYRPALEALAKR
jgi:hypothetical protein